MNRFVRVVPKIPNGCISDSRKTSIYSKRSDFPLREQVKERDYVAFVGVPFSDGVLFASIHSHNHWSVNTSSFVLLRITYDYYVEITHPCRSIRTGSRTVKQKRSVYSHVHVY
jgi:hypothetical protein